jgi:lipoyl(octanoyl) transferase
MESLRGELWSVDLGRRRYAEVLELQRAAARARAAGSIPEDVLLLVEHEPVVTLGRSSRERNLLASPALLEARGVELFEVERGGDVTFHGPGQLVGYPIIDLKRHRQDLHWYLRQVEESLIRTIAGYGLRGVRNAGYTGVWVGGQQAAGDPDRLEPAEDGSPPRKIASIGVHAREWVTWHGFALNAATDLSWFDLIVPCGIPEVQMTSLARELESAVQLDEVARRAAEAFAATFALECRWVQEAALALEPAAAPH